MHTAIKLIGLALLIASSLDRAQIMKLVPWTNFHTKISKLLCDCPSPRRVQSLGTLKSSKGDQQVIARKGFNAVFVIRL